MSVLPNAEAWPIYAAGNLDGGEGGIRTHVPGNPDHLISSQRRYGHFGTSPACGEQQALFYQFFSLFIVELFRIRDIRLYYCSIWQKSLLVMVGFIAICSEVPII